MNLGCEAKWFVAVTPTACDWFLLRHVTGSAAVPRVNNRLPDTVTH